MNKKSIINSTKKLFKNKFKTDPLVISTAPGRINLIGEHLDLVQLINLLMCGYLLS